MTYRLRFSPDGYSDKPIDVSLPASKSISNRVLVMEALARGDEGSSLLRNLAECDDTFVMRRALHHSAKYDSDSERVEVNIMAAGTAMRFLTAYYSATAGTHTLTGTERMRNRPIEVLVDALRSLGADITYTDKEGFPPLLIRGKSLSGGDISLPGNISSQYISAILMIAPMLSGGLTITLTGDVVSRSYIEMTVSLMRDFGVECTWIGDKTLRVGEGGYSRVAPYEIESDWSAASYCYELVALSATPITIHIAGLGSEGLQGDSCVARLFEGLGVRTDLTPSGVKLSKCECTSERFEADMTLCPDLIQTLVVTCAMLGLPFRISGAQSLRIKETDRIAALQAELRKLGIEVEEPTTGILTWCGDTIAPSNETSDIVIDTYDDHRMAMAFAPVAAIREGIGIRNPEVVTKSFPKFWEEFAKVGLMISEE